MNDFIGVEASEEWFVVHSDGHEHKPRVQKSDLLDLVTAYNNKVREQLNKLECSTDNMNLIHNLQKTLKKVRKRIRRVPRIITLKYQSIFINLSCRQYQGILEGIYIVVYWYEHLFLLDNIKFLYTYLIGEPIDVFIVDADCLDPNLIKEEVIILDYEC